MGCGGDRRCVLPTDSDPFVEYRLALLTWNTYLIHEEQSCKIVPEGISSIQLLFIDLRVWKEHAKIRYPTIGISTLLTRGEDLLFLLGMLNFCQ